jgi:hypothetical protein
MMKPVKAFAYQDHQAHITVHMSAMQDPKIMQLLQNNPMAQQLQAAMMAHINEHLGFAYRVQIEQQLGFNLPPQTDDAGDDLHIDPDVEARLAPMLSMAAQRLLMQNQGQMAQQQAQQQAQDPLIQMQQQELQLKAQEQQRKAQKDQADMAINQQRLQIEQQRIAQQAQQANRQINVDALKTVAQLKADHTDSTDRNRLQAATTLANLDRQRAQDKSARQMDAIQTLAQHEHDRVTQTRNNQHDHAKHQETLRHQRDLANKQPKGNK